MSNLVSLTPQFGSTKSGEGREEKGREGSGSLLRQRRLSVPPPSRLGTVITEPYHRGGRFLFGCFMRVCVPGT